MDEAKVNYQSIWLDLLEKITAKKTALLREILQEIPSKVLPNFKQPLILTDFLASILED